MYRSSALCLVWFGLYCIYPSLIYPFRQRQAKILPRYFKECGDHLRLLLRIAFMSNTGRVTSSPS